MGFPDNYTDLAGAKKTNRYQATGNSWAVPVVRWLGNRLINDYSLGVELNKTSLVLSGRITKISENETFINFSKDLIQIDGGYVLNCTSIPEVCSFTSMSEIVSPDAPEDIYISPVGCYGIVRRKLERKLNINPRLEEVLLSISSEMSAEEIDKRSRVQHRGRFSTPNPGDVPIEKNEEDPSTFEDVPSDSSPRASSIRNVEPDGQLSLFDLI